MMNFFPKRSCSYFARPGETLGERVRDTEEGQEISVDVFNIPINLAHYGIRASMAIIQKGVELGIDAASFLAEGAKPIFTDPDFHKEKVYQFPEAETEEAREGLIINLQQEIDKARADRSERRAA